MNKIKIAISIAIIISLISLSIPMSINTSYNAMAISQSNNSYIRINFNVKSKTETVPLTYVKDFLILNNIKPVRVWVLIDDDITAMFNVDNSWDLNNLDKVIISKTLRMYNVRKASDLNELSNILHSSKKPCKQLVISYEKAIGIDSKIIGEFSASNPTVMVMAIDFPYSDRARFVFSNKTSILPYEYKVSCKIFNGILFSPQLQWDVEYEKIAMPIKNEQSAYMLSYDSNEYPGDDTWLPNHVVTLVKTLSNSEHTRFIEQKTEWHDNQRISFFKNHWNSAYEQTSEFYESNGECYVKFEQNNSIDMIESWVSNYPDPFVESRIGDISYIENLTIGCAQGTKLDTNNLYYYSLFVKPGNIDTGDDLQVDEKPCHVRLYTHNYHQGLYVYHYKIRTQRLYDCCQNSPVVLYVPSVYTWSPEICSY